MWLVILAMRRPITILVAVLAVVSGSYLATRLRLDPPEERMLTKATNLRLGADE